METDLIEKQLSPGELLKRENIIIRSIAANQEHGTASEASLVVGLGVLYEDVEWQATVVYEPHRINALLQVGTGPVDVDALQAVHQKVDVYQDAIHSAALQSLRMALVLV